MACWQGRSYPLGTRVQHRNGYIVVKTEDGMISEGRRVWELSKGDLAPGDRVFHSDGDRTNNNPNNLVKVHFNATKFVMLKESKVLWLPKLSRNGLTNDVLAIAKRRFPEKIKAAA